jgi:hypothetical protein
MPTVQVLTLTGGHYTFEVDRGDELNLLGDRLFQTVMVPKDQLKFFYKGLQREMTDTLESIEFADGDTISLIMAPIAG